MAVFQQGITLKALLENPDLLNPPKPNADGPKDKKDDFSEIDNIISGASAFLGPNIWGKDDTLPYDAADLQLEYMDLDEFLNESGIVHTDPIPIKRAPSSTPPHQAPSSPEQPTPLQWSPPQKSKEVSPPSPVESRASVSSPSRASVSSPTHSCPSPNASSVDAWAVERSTRISIPSPCSPSHAKDIHQENTEAINGPISAIPYEPSEGDLELAQIPGQEEFDPRRCNFTDEDLKPQPMIKKSKKVFVPEDLKDDRYWNRRKKNNVAAKRSRDARRIKENQIAMRAAFLERENTQYKVDLALVKEENEKLKARLAKYEETS